MRLGMSSVSKPSLLLLLHWLLGVWKLKLKSPKLIFGTPLVKKGTFRESLKKWRRTMEKFCRSRMEKFCMVLTWRIQVVYGVQTDASCLVFEFFGFFCRSVLV